MNKYRLTIIAEFDSNHENMRDIKHHIESPCAMAVRKEVAGLFAQGYVTGPIVTSEIEDVIEVETPSEGSQRYKYV